MSIAVFIALAVNKLSSEASSIDVFTEIPLFKIQLSPSYVKVNIDPCLQRHLAGASLPNEIIFFAVVESTFNLGAL